MTADTAQSNTLETIDGKLVYSIKEFCEAAGLCRNTVSKEIKAGNIRTLKARDRILIPVDAVREWLSHVE